MDAYLDWAQDFQLTLSGDLALASGWDEVRQSVFRNALTNPGVLEPSGIYQPADFKWDVNYGLGLPAYVGEPITPDILSKIAALVRNAALANPAVTQAAQPVVTVSEPLQDNLTIDMEVTLQAGEVQTLTIGVP